MDDEPSSYVKYSSFEPYMLKGKDNLNKKENHILLVLMSEEKEFEPDDPETLIAAFKV